MQAVVVLGLWAPLVIALFALHKLTHRGRVLLKASGSDHNGAEARLTVFDYRAEPRRFPGGDFVSRIYQHWISDVGLATLPMLWSVIRAEASPACAADQGRALQRKLSGWRTPQQRVADLVGAASVPRLERVLVDNARGRLNKLSGDDRAIVFQFGFFHDAAFLERGELPEDGKPLEELAEEVEDFRQTFARVSPPRSMVEEAAKLYPAMKAMVARAERQAELRVEGPCASYNTGRLHAPGGRRMGARSRTSHGSSAPTSGSRRVTSRSAGGGSLDDPDPESEARKGTYAVAAEAVACA